MSSNDSESNVQKAITLCSLFESEILVWLILRNWNHPYSEDAEYRSSLLDSATELLHAIKANPDNTYIQGMPSQDMNFIAALWYCENCDLDANRTDKQEQEINQSRLKWLTQVRHALPSCFCPQDDLSFE